MMLYADDQSYKQRAAAFDAKRAAASALRKGAADMAAITNGEPTPSDVMMLHDPVVSPDLRSAIIDARKRMWMKSPDDRLAFRDGLTPLGAAIRELAEQHGGKFAALSKFISPRSMPNDPPGTVIENRHTEAKLAKFDGGAQRANDIRFLVDPRIPAPLRRRLIAAKNALDEAHPDRRQTFAKTIAPSLIQQIDDLRAVIGPDGVAAIRRMLGRD